ncbi:MAG TPA: hypothetical protein VK926_09570 [Gaiellaceae bacterium]|nr:hypothetical protein [Gaiellaceae bacterium]
MKVRLLLLAVIVVVLAAPTAQSAPAKRGTAPVIDLATGPVDGAWSALVRTSSGLSMTFHTSGLPAREAFTVWFVVFNNPAACTAPIAGLTNCGEADLFDPAVEAAVFRAGGHVIGTSGPTTISGSVKVGQTRNALTFPDGTAPFTTLMNPLTAEVHLVALRHGAWVPASPEMFHTFWACSLPPGPGVNELGCADWQVSIHLPPSTA